MPKAHIPLILLALCLAEVVVGSTYFLLSLKNTRDKAYSEIRDPTALPRGLPVRLKIPKINVDANIQYVSMTAQGEMEVPNNTVDVGWFFPGTRPGDKGSAVIAGHVDGQDNTTGVFFNLNKLKPGDKLYVEDNLGKLTIFVVQYSRIYPPGYANEVFRSNDIARLNLVTCDGIWDGSQKSYTNRLVVFANLSTP